MSPIKNKHYPRHVLTLLLPFALILGIAFLWNAGNRKSAVDSFVVTPAIFEKWTPLQGELQATDPVSLRAELDGLSKITWLIEDGTPVQTGEELARFDPSELEEKKLTLVRDLDIANAELTSLTQAQHPLEIQRLENEERSLQAEKREQELLRTETQELVTEMLLPKGELDRYQNSLDDLDAKIQAASEQIRLTKTILHPAIEKKAEARRNAAKIALDRLEERLTNTLVKAPVNGTVYLPPLHIDGEHRQVRVGDGLFRNQVFMEVADLTSLELKSYIGEQHLSRIVPGLQARVRFPAYPSQIFTATLSRVGSHPEGTRKLYPVQFVLDESVSNLRPGLTAEIDVLEYQQEKALLVPREFIRYRNGQAEVQLQKAGWKKVVLGDGNAGFVNIQEGINEGDLLIRP